MFGGSKSLNAFIKALHPQQDPPEPEEVLEKLKVCLSDPNILWSRPILDGPYVGYTPLHLILKTVALKPYLHFDVLLPLLEGRNLPWNQPVTVHGDAEGETPLLWLMIAAGGENTKHPNNVQQNAQHTELLQNAVSQLITHNSLDWHASVASQAEHEGETPFFHALLGLSNRDPWFPWDFLVKKLFESGTLDIAHHWCVRSNIHGPYMGSNPLFWLSYAAAENVDIANSVLRSLLVKPGLHWNTGMLSETHATAAQHCVLIALERGYLSQCHCKTFANAPMTDWDLSIIAKNDLQYDQETCLNILMRSVFQGNQDAMALFKELSPEKKLNWGGLVPANSIRKQAQSPLSWLIQAAVQYPPLREHCNQILEKGFTTFADFQQQCDQAISNIHSNPNEPEEVTLQRKNFARFLVDYRHVFGLFKRAQNGEKLDFHRELQSLENKAKSIGLTGGSSEYTSGIGYEACFMMVELFLFIRNIYQAKYWIQKIPPSEPYYAKAKISLAKAMLANATPLQYPQNAETPQQRIDRKSKNHFRRVELWMAFQATMNINEQQSTEELLSLRERIAITYIYGKGINSPFVKNLSNVAYLNKEPAIAKEFLDDKRALYKSEKNVAALQKIIATLTK